ncbi:MAG: L-seryl-tRNA(Sec) selenium transferase, partial [Myxococcota bacterium]|nr:L-seryl-tRNA(Sec) selenium transferase [Myxococcota bacterium]
NATGIVLHTNLGRAPLSPRAADAVNEVARGYSNLELELSTGKRGGRLDGIRECLRLLLDCEDAVVVNNNAAAVMLMLAAHAAGKSVLVSRGELVEIGGSFRVPDVMALSGARLVEVGTTNRTRAADYERAVTEDTAVVLRVHPSNFTIEGFTERPSREELSAIGIPFFEDLGSGALVDFEKEPDIADALASGASLVCFSGDKLLGGSQAGIIVGKREAVESCRRHPLYRALRLDKLALVALEATLRLYVEGAHDDIPALDMLRKGDQQDRAMKLAATLKKHGLEAVAEEDVGYSGGGALPGQAIPSWVVRVVCTSPDAPARALREQTPAILARVARSGLIIDPRCLLEEDWEAVVAGLLLAFHAPTGEE